MNCDELVELVTAYLEGSLTRADTTRFEDHLAECEGCRRYVEQMRRTLDVLGHLPSESLSGVSRERLMDAFADWKDGRA